MGRGVVGLASRLGDLRPYAGDWEHQETVDWLTTQPGLLAGYESEWVAFAGRTIIAHAPDLSQVMDEARSLGVPDPLLVPVPPRGYLVG